MSGANKTELIQIKEHELLFADGTSLSSEHDSDCCESHYLSFQDLKLEDFAGLSFDFSGDFFERVEGYGIRLIPVVGHPVNIPGYGYNNGYYSSELTLVVEGPFAKRHDISDCQVIEG